MGRGVRLRPRDRRRNWTQKARIGNQTVYLNVGMYDDGAVAEVFVDLAKQGSMVRTVMDTMAVCISVGLQYGVPLSEYIDALKGETFEPNGAVEGSAVVREARSILDWIAQELEAYEAGRLAGSS